MASKVNILIHKLKILVTAEGGFIGSHLTEYLIEKEHKVKVFARYGSRKWR